MGQTLLPDHLKAQEESVLADTSLRFQMQGLPFYGVGRLIINETLLGEGILTIQELTLVMASGLLLNVPGNATISGFNLNGPGTTSVSVYLHACKDEADRSAAAGGWAQEAEQEVPKIVYPLVLSSEQNHTGAFETLKLAEFEKNAEGLWQLSRSYVPPLLQVGDSPFFRKELSDLAEALGLFQYNLSLEVAGYLSGDSLSSVKQCLKAVFRAQRLLANLAAQVKLHPFYLYEELNILYAEICFYRNISPQDIAAAYDHKQLGTIADMAELLVKQMQLVRSKPPYLPFEKADNIHKVKLPDEIRQAGSVYLLAQKDRVTTALPMDNLKLASLSRLSFVHRMALHGVPVQKVDNPSFQHSFGAEVDFYQIREGEEWDHILNEMEMAFFDRPELENTTFFLFWRIG